MSRTTDVLTNTNRAAWLRRALCLILAMVVGLLGPLSAYAQTVVYFHNDPAGSPIAATDASGNVLWRESYRPYGERMLKPAAANTQWFHGKSLDPDTGMEDFGARNYDPVLGRFLSIDPVDFTEKNIHSFNRYAYGNNNPLKYKDPDGRWAWLINVFVRVGAWIASNGARQGAANAATQYAAGEAGVAVTTVVAAEAGKRVVQQVANNTENITKNTERIYHRLGDSSEVIKSIKESGELLGNAARNYMPGLIPKAKAYEGPLPKDRKGFEFRTGIEPDSGHVPGQPIWSAGRSGVPERNGQAVLPVEVTKIQD